MSVAVATTCNWPFTMCALKKTDTLELKLTLKLRMTPQLFGPREIELISLRHANLIY